MPKKRSAGQSPSRAWWGRRWLSCVPQSRIRSPAASKLSNWARARNSSQIVFQKRSSLPRVMGWCGRLLMWCTRSFRSSASNRVVPRQLENCRPWSESSSLGTPYSATARRYTSRTCSAVWLRKTSSPTT